MILETRDTTLHALATQCLQVRDLIETVDDPTMRAAIDLLLFEVARKLAETDSPDPNGES